MDVVSLDILVHPFYGLGHDPAIPQDRRHSIYYLESENYQENGIAGFIRDNGLSVDGYVKLLQEMWLSRFEEQAMDGYLLVIPNADRPQGQSDRITPSREGGYRVRHRQEEGLIADARKLFGKRLIVEPYPNGAAVDRMASRMLDEHPSIARIEATAYGERYHSCVCSYASTFILQLESRIQGSFARLRPDRWLCGDMPDGKEEELERRPYLRAPR